MVFDVYVATLNAFGKSQEKNVAECGGGGREGSCGDEEGRRWPSDYYY